MANKTTTEETATTLPLTGAELIRGVQDDENVKMTAQDVANLSSEAIATAQAAADAAQADADTAQATADTALAGNFTNVHASNNIVADNAVEGEVLRGSSLEVGGGNATIDENGNVILSGYLHLTAAFHRQARTVSGDDNVSATDDIVYVNTSGGAVVLTLPSGSINKRILTIKKITTDANQLTLARNGENIEGVAADITTTAVDRPCYRLQYNSGWWLI